MGEVIQLRDYKRKEEQSAEIIRLAREIFGQIEIDGWPETQHKPDDKEPA